MKVSIVTIGDEILNGTTVDTNSAFIAKNCITHGMSVRNTFSVPDSFEGIYEGLSLGQKNAEVIFITGGLGPTKDDITKQALANFFKTTLEFDENVFLKIKAYFEKRGAKQVELNRKLAYIPKNASLIDNDRGTAMGMWFEQDQKTFISMPGVPHEMQYMLTNHILPKITERYTLPKIINKYIMCAGIGESAIYERIEDIEVSLPPYISLAYLPNLGNVKLRLSSIAKDREVEREKELETFQLAIKERIEKHVYSLDDQISLAQVVGNLLIEKKETLATAESCTGGYISHLITSTPGSSMYYEGSIIAYSYNIKESLLHVEEETLNEYGAVSEETVREMTEGLLRKLKTSYGISVSGIAGPSGGTPEKPVGTVWIAVGNKHKVIAKKFELTKQRDYNVKISAMIALNMLRIFILDNHG